MATERQWDAVGPILLTANGTTNGVLQVVDTAGFFFGMQCTLQNISSQLTVYVKMVVDSTTMYVGASKGGLDHAIDLSAFTVISNSTIRAAAQNKSTVPMEGRLLATYETDPINAWRTSAVDSYGNKYTKSNPFPVDATITVDSVQLFTLPYDSIQASYPTTVQEVYMSYLGGLSGTLQQTVTVNYTDTTKNYITTVLRTPVS
jgi:hypothetical protein